MKILILAHKMPYPPKDGGSYVTLSFAKALAELGCEITLLAMNTYKRRFNISDIPIELRQKINFHSVDVDTKIKLIPLLINLFQKKSYHIWRYGSSKKFAEKLVNLLQSEKFDIVQLEGLYLSPYVELIRRHSKAKIVMRAHNVEYEILERYAEFEKSILKKFWLKIQAKRLKSYELGRLNLYDAVIPITERDAQILKADKIPSIVIPAGFEIKDTEPNFEDVEFPSLFYIGALDWFPNQQGVEWFLKNVWDKIYRRFPDLKFYIAGRNSDKWKFLRVNKFPNVEVVGEVEDSREFIKAKSIMVVPLFAGSGIRVKIIEAMSLGKAVISTSVGAEGIKYKDGENILIANTVDEFVKKISICVEDKSFCFNLGKRAFELVNDEYNIVNLVGELKEFYESILLINKSNETNEANIHRFIR